MRSFYIALSGASNFDEIELQAKRMERPRHSIPVLARRLGAKIYQTDQDAPSPILIDKLKARVLGTPAGWSFAREMVPRLGPDDTVFCLDIGVGAPMASLLRGKPDRPKLAVYVHNLDRPRGRLGTSLFGITKTVDLFASCCSSQLDFLVNDYGVPRQNTALLLQHVDNKFYKPGPAILHKRRPLIVSVGLERRDYVTLAAAVQDLDVDVIVDAYSPNARSSSGAFPKMPPANLTYRTSSPTELVQLYRDADLVVVSTLPNNYAGLTTFVEALACAKPVIASRTLGLADYLRPGHVITVEPSNPNDMKQAIVRLLSDPAAAERLAASGFEAVSQLYDFEEYIETVAARLEAL